MAPMLAQYRSIKTRFPDALVLFRLGDFYETFDADAKVAARELELTLTSRFFGNGVRLPMAGVPHHHVQAYIAKLIEKGFKVALVEQLEDPKKVKKLVKRDVIRIITPGTVVEDALLRGKSENYLAAIVRAQSGALKRGVRKENTRAINTLLAAYAPTPQWSYGLALLDISTGEFATTQIEGDDAEAKLFEELQRVQASEYVVPQSLANDDQFVARLKAMHNARVSSVAERAATSEGARQMLQAQFRVKSLDAYGCEQLPLATEAAGAVLQYLKDNQPNDDFASSLTHINHLWTFTLGDHMTLDAATRRNLELTSSMQEAVETPRRGVSTRSLFGVLDHSVTAMGARLLRRWVQQPLLDLERIHGRLDAVEELHHDNFLREDLRKSLDGLYDVERLVGRIGFGSANARDLIGLKRALLRLPAIKARLLQTHAARLRELGEQLDELQDIAGLIAKALVEDPPMFIKEGGLIQRGYHVTLDELRMSSANEKSWLSELEDKERKRTGIKNLHVRYNEVFGFFIEVPRSAADQIPKEYERRATISHAERYVTPELKAREAMILATEDRVKDLEYELFVEVRNTVAQDSARLQSAARILAQVDALCTLAEAAAKYNYVKPTVDDGEAIEIREGRHPVVERFLREDETFVPNDVHLDGETQRLIILTGPNMSGKSVFIRQVALITLMAQMGSFVPAASARIGIADRIFTRVGASDDIAQGRSTFLVEMSETSYILRHASARSLIVLDEVGRGTSTYDGISLAWAIAEEIHNNLCAKTLFATHYHELTQLAALPSPSGRGAGGEGEFPNSNAIRNYTMAIKERGNEVIFLRQVIAGGAERSFGIHVARLAGLHPRIIARAEEMLRELEAKRAAVGENETGDGSTTTGDGRQSAEYASSTNDEGRTTNENPLPTSPATQGRSDDFTTAQGRSRSPSSVAHVATGEVREGVDERGVVRESQVLYDAHDARAEQWREVVRELAQVDIANITPVQALLLLNEMQGRVKELSADESLR